MPAVRHALMAVLLLLALGAGAAAAADDPFPAANALYSKSVDLANEGRYEEALAAADQALALNAPAINHLVQANRAGILVMLGRYEEAIAAADAALAAEGDLPATRAAAYYNKGDALRHLGKMEEAQEAFGQAYALDSSLPRPQDLPSPTAAPVNPALAAGCVTAAALLLRSGRKP